MKKILYILVGSIAALVLVVVIFVFTFDINAYKPRIEAAASEVTKMNVRINGKLKLTPFPRPGVLIEDILVQNEGKDVASAKKAEVKIRLLPLLWREVVIRQVGLIAPNFYITRDRRGRFNFETVKKPAVRPFELEKIFINGGHVLYLDEKSGGQVEANGCKLIIKNISGGGKEFIRTLSFEGHLSCGEVKAEELNILDVNAALKTQRGEFEANPFTMKILGGDGRGRIKGVMTGETPEFSIDFAITKFYSEEALETFKQKMSIRGELDLKLQLTMKGKSANGIMRTAQGEISLLGQNLFFESLDLDRVLEKYEKSQHVDLVDIGAFFLVGPLGTLLTKGYDFGSVYKESLGGETTVLRLVSDWKVRNGIAEAEDVAFTTRKNRIALKGRIDFVNKQFDDVRVAVLDEKGCVRLSQKIHGRFRLSRIGKVSPLRSIAGPVLNLLEEPKKLLKNRECRIFYAGSVEHP